MVSGRQPIASSDDSALREAAKAETVLAKEHVKANIKQIADIFVELGYAKTADEVKLTIGPELEALEVMGGDSAKLRRRVIQQESKTSYWKCDGWKPYINNKTQSWAPEEVRSGALSERYNPGGKFKNRHTMTVEPAIAPNVWVENGEEVAGNQIEFVFPPHDPLWAVAHLNAQMYKMSNEASKLGLKRIDFLALPHPSAAPNGIHLNSVITVDGKNAFSAKEWENGNREGVASDLALCVAQAHTEYLQHSAFMFARAASDYERFRPEVPFSPAWIGIPSRREIGKFCSAMLRGEGRKSTRENSADPEKPDAGPLRFEFRLTAPGALGYHDKKAYPEQTALGYEMMEAYTHMLLQGCQMWKERELQKRNHQTPPTLSEYKLRPDALNLPTCKDAKEARERFCSSEQVKEYWGEDRIALITQLSDQLDALHARDAQIIRGDITR